MQKHIFYLILLFAVSSIILPVTAYAQNPDAILGIWETALGKGHVKIVKDEKTSKYSGKIIWLKNPKDEDGNPIRDSDGGPVLRLTVLKEMKFDEDEWNDGIIYDPESGKTYYCTMTLKTDSTLEVRGSLDSMGWIGRTEEWKRPTQ